MVNTRFTLTIGVTIVDIARLTTIKAVNHDARIYTTVNAVQYQCKNNQKVSSKIKESN